MEHCDTERFPHPISNFHLISQWKITGFHFCPGIFVTNSLNQRGLGNLGLYRTAGAEPINLFCRMFVPQLVLAIALGATAPVFDPSTKSGFEVDSNSTIGCRVLCAIDSKFAIRITSRVAFGAQFRSQTWFVFNALLFKELCLKRMMRKQIPYGSSVFLLKPSKKYLP